MRLRHVPKLTSTFNNFATRTCAARQPARAGSCCASTHIQCCQAIAAASCCRAGSLAFASANCVNCSWPLRALSNSAPAYHAPSFAPGSSSVPSRPVGSSCVLLATTALLLQQECRCDCNGGGDGDLLYLIQSNARAHAKRLQNAVPSLPVILNTP